MIAKRILPIAAALAFLQSAAFADGLVVRPKSYKGSLAEKSQEAMIVFRPGTETKSAEQDMILKISVAGKTESFAWIIPFPNPPKTAKEDAVLFRELFEYVDRRRGRTGKAGGSKLVAPATPAAGVDNKVEVVSREVVGSFEITVVREVEEGGLNPWLEENGYQKLEGAEETIGFYRKKGYVFACVKVADATVADGTADLHPLRFTFETGGRDGIYFPMKLTGLQAEPFDVNLYVFYKAWINDSLNGYGFEHRGFTLHHRDWDTDACEPNAGKSWSLPERDPYLKPLARTFPNLKAFFRKRHPGDRFYLTNIRARNVRPEDIREWPTDLWLFPYYIDRKFVPYDARDGKPAARD